MAIEKPELTWKNNAPFSETFHDIYFSTEDGLKESRHVFIEGNHLVQRWLADSRDFTIYENGFGTGLNFLLTAETFLSTVAKKDQILNYVAVEKYPLSAQEIQRSLLLFSELAPVAESLLFQYPRRIAGFHRLSFAGGRIHLTLIFEDSLYALNQIFTAGNIDAWFLDGFSPAHNPEMWSHEVFQKMAILSEDGSTVATFTSAGHVRRKLDAAGFKVEKIPGFGRKRQIITATFLNDLSTAAIDRKNPDKKAFAKKIKIDKHTKPWFHAKTGNIINRKSNQKKVAIIGAGLAGCAAAEALHRRNYSVELIDRHEEICREASGNPRGIFFPVIHQKPTFTSRFSISSYLYLIRHLHSLAKEGFGESMGLKQNGLCRLLQDGKDVQNYLNALKQNPDYAEVFQFQEAPKAANFFESGFLSPKGLCQANIFRNEKGNKNQDKIQRTFSTQIKSICQKDGLWLLLDEKNKTITQSDILILAGSHGIKDFAQTSWIPMTKIRGQLMILDTINKPFENPVLSSTYVVPSENKLIIGATHDFSDNENVQRQQNYELWETTKKYIPDPESLRDKNIYKTTEEWIDSAVSRVSFRSAAEDHFPVIGPIPDAPSYKNIFDPLKHGEAAYFHKKGYDPQPAAWHTNLYTISGLGSRGIMYSQLGAEIVASMINGEPLPIEKDIAFALNPARFLFRSIKRNNA